MPEKKLQPRLQRLFDITSALIDTQQAENTNEESLPIYDLCTDHGLLGEALLRTHHDIKVYFNDVRPHLMQQLAHRLNGRKSVLLSPYHIEAEDCRDLILASNDGASPFPIVVLAGVGGDLAVEVINHLASQGSFTLLLCVTNNQYLLRAHLASLNVGLLSECLVEDKGRVYECLCVAINHENKQLSQVSLTGEMWRKDGISAKLLDKYIALMMSQKKNQNRMSEQQDLLEHVLKCYCEQRSALDV